MKTILWTLFVLTLFGSCTTAKRCAKKFPQVAQVDSIYVETLKEVEIPLPGDTIEIEIPIDCPDQDVGTVEIGKLKSEISILNKKLTSKTTIKPDTVLVYVPEIREKIIIEKQPVQVRYIPRFNKIMTWTGIVFILGLIAYLGLKIRSKGILKIFRK